MHYGSTYLNVPSHILLKAPILDPNVWIHRMVVEAFDRFDNFQHGCDDQNQNPTNNPPKMPTITYQAMKLVKALGLNYEPIHACTNICVLFQGDLKQSHVYPKCDANRYVDGSIRIPQKNA